MGFRSLLIGCAFADTFLRSSNVRRLSLYSDPLKYGWGFSWDLFLFLFNLLLKHSGIRIPRPFLSSPPQPTTLSVPAGGRGGYVGPLSSTVSLNHRKHNLDRQSLGPGVEQP